jgi:hypothetical protein
MGTRANWDRFRRNLRCGVALVVGLLWTATGFAQDTHSAQEGSTPPGSQSQSSKQDQKDQKSSDSATTKIRIQVNDANDHPVTNASVYVRYYMSGGFLRHEKLAELSFKTNQEGSVKIPAIPQGKVMIQVIATGWHTYGKWYDMDKEEESVSIKLEQPPHWY